MIFFTSDTHFNHKNIIEYEKRPFKNIDEMNEALIKNWNACVKKEDTVYHLGDFGFGSKEKLKSICTRLNGNKILILGNHDYNPCFMYDIGFISVLQLTVIKHLHWKIWLTHWPLNDLDEGSQRENDFNFHGHIHGKRKFLSNKINLSTEVWDYSPVNFKKIFSEYKKQRSTHEVV